MPINVFEVRINIGQMVSPKAAILAAYQFDAFGRTVDLAGEKAAENPWRFSSKPLESETGLYNYGFRYYAPDTGRWLSRDPIGDIYGIQPETLPEGPSLYSFVGNDGINNTDYLGLHEGYPKPVGKDGLGNWVFQNEDGSLFAIDNKTKQKIRPNQYLPPKPDLPPAKLISCLTRELLKGHKEMRDANVIGGDKYFHCMAMCKAARKCASSSGALNAGAMREIADLVKGRFKRPTYPDGTPFTNEEHAQDSLDDMAANRTGANCPVSKTCECCCERYKVPGIK